MKKKWEKNNNTFEVILMTNYLNLIKKIPIKKILKFRTKLKKNLVKLLNKKRV